MSVPRDYAKLLFGRSEQEERVAAESRIEVKITWPQQARLLIAKKHWANSLQSREVRVPSLLSSEQ